jgi:hypothetical protein
MSNYERSIVSIIEPNFKKSPTDTSGKLLIDELFIEDSESTEAKDKMAGNMRPVDFKQSSRAGAFMPMIAINTLIMQEDEIDDFEIDLGGRIPRLMLTYTDTSRKFNVSGPVDGDIVSVYLRPPDSQNQKPIRIDFIIVRVIGDPEDQSYFINGVMRIPKFYSETYKSFPSNTSFEHLGDMCEEIGLGFASNETSTDDAMTRLIPSDTYQTFIEHTVSSAYKDDDSFFDWYIDPYYYLCFVNVNKQFSLEDKSEEINISDSVPMSGMQGKADLEDPDSQKGSLVLTNLNTMGGKNIFIKDYSLENSSGRIWMDNGYKRYVQWLNIEESDIEYQEAFVDPLTTPGAEDKFILLKGRRSDGPPTFPVPLYKEESKYKWMGKQAGSSFGGNVHDNYCYAQILNFQNLEELKKTRLIVDIDGMNHYLYKYQRIPVLIYETSVNKNASAMQARDEALGENQPAQEPGTGTGMFSGAAAKDAPSDSRSEGTGNVQDQVKNEFLSGYYVIADIKYKYREGEGINQRLTLIRREWPIPAKNDQAM